MNLRRALWLVLVVLWAFTALAQSLYVFSCTEDTHIDGAKRNLINMTALNFVKALLASDVRAGHDMFSAEEKTAVSHDQLAQTFAGIKHFEPTNPAIQHTYYIELKGKSPGRVVCAADSTTSDGRASVGAATVPEQAHVILSAETRNNTLAISVWLVLEQNAWKIQSFWINVATLADKDSKQLWQLGRTQQAKGHLFNAAMLYAAATQIANRGPNFQLGITQAISEDLSKLTLPPAIQGTAPFFWKNSSVTYKVLNVGPIAIAGKMYLVIVHEVSPWESDSQVDGWNKQLLSYFKQKFPEYSDVFAGLVARAMERGTNRGFGTVEELPIAKP